MKMALGLSYVGAAYQGWQRQPSAATVQGCLELALQSFANQLIPTVCAGRTDAGVHGLNQVVHLETSLQRPEISWVRGTNRYLPPDIAVQWCHPVSDSFHARFSAIGRRYIYLLRESVTRPALENGRAGWVFRPLNWVAMQEAAAHLVGVHDFSAFRSSQCQARSPIRRLSPVIIQRSGAYWRFDFDGSAFLHHMVRNIVGCLVSVGQGRYPSAWMGEVLRSRDRRLAAPTFAAAGLYFAGPTYDEHWGLPSQTCVIDWLPMSAIPLNPPPSVSMP